ncbi:MAG: small, acid-soluble spore protein, alpha/beta type [Firmicutes bacterium]|nr:small, acid-soluble spore protein, alpha/beta type [Bacillota bacterium]
MARRTRQPLLPAAVRRRFKAEVAEELGLVDDIAAQGWAGMPARELGRIGGRIGGNMVRVMIRAAEQQLAGSDGE